MKYYSSSMIHTYMYMWANVQHVYNLRHILMTGAFTGFNRPNQKFWTKLSSSCFQRREDIFFSGIHLVQVCNLRQTILSHNVTNTYNLITSQITSQFELLRSCFAYCSCAQTSIMNPLETH